MAKMKFTPYRGEVEKVTEVYAGEVITHANHLQVNLGYDFTDKDGTNIPVRIRIIIPRAILVMNQSIVYMLEDQDFENANTIIQLDYSKEPVWIFTKPDECNKLFEFISKWMLAQ